MRGIIRAERGQKGSRGEAKVRSCSFPCLLTLLTRSVLVCCRPLSRLLSLCSVPFLPPGSGQKWALELVWALKSFGYQPSVALYLQPSVKGPPAATYRFTSLPWPREAGARSEERAAAHDPHQLTDHTWRSSYMCLVYTLKKTHFNIPVHTPLLCLDITLPARLVRRGGKMWRLWEAWLKTAHHFSRRARYNVKRQSGSFV